MHILIMCVQPLFAGSTSVSAPTALTYHLLSQDKTLNISVTLTGSYSVISWARNGVAIPVNSQQYLYRDFGRQLQLNAGGLPLVNYTGQYIATVISNSSTNGVTFRSSRNFVVALPGMCTWACPPLRQPRQLPPLKNLRTS